MISDDFARQLRRAGVRWDPAPGDQFRIEAELVQDDVYILSHMVIEARTYATGTVLHFNGTTEWALDSLAKEDALWLPREDQLRELLGGTFCSMEREDECSGYAPKGQTAARSPSSPMPSRTPTPRRYSLWYSTPPSSRARSAAGLFGAGLLRAGDCTAPALQ